MKLTVVSCDSCRWESPPLVESAANGFRKLGNCRQCKKAGKVVPYKFREVDTFYLKGGK